jgi:hypothetical protein
MDGMNGMNCGMNDITMGPRAIIVSCRALNGKLAVEVTYFIQKLIRLRGFQSLH